MTKKAKTWFWIFVVAVVIAFGAAVVYNVLTDKEEVPTEETVVADKTFNDYLQQDFDSIKALYPDCFFYSFMATVRDSLSTSETFEILETQTTFQVGHEVHHFYRNVELGRTWEDIEQGHWGGLYALDSIDVKISAEAAFELVKEDTTVEVPGGKFITFNHTIGEPELNPNPNYVFGSVKTSLVAVDAVTGKVRQYSKLNDEVVGLEPSAE